MRISLYCLRNNNAIIRCFSVYFISLYIVQFVLLSVFRENGIDIARLVLRLLLYNQIQTIAL